MKQLGDITVGSENPLEALEKVYQIFERHHGAVRRIRMNRRTYMALEDHSAPLVASDGMAIADFNMENGEVVLWGSAVVVIDNNLPDNKYWLYDL